MRETHSMVLSHTMSWQLGLKNSGYKLR